MIHHQVGDAFVRVTAVKQLHNVWVIQACEGLALVSKTIEKLLASRLRTYDFDRHLLLVLVVGTHCEIHRSHTAHADSLDELVCARAAAHHEIRHYLSRQRSHHRCVQERGFGYLVFPSSE